ncbi:MAG: zinc ribbon domain-containing protein, partial [Pyrinomonadaceae bacterium]
MRYCHECGAEVAPEDIFCLYCGITLLPISTVSEDENSLPVGDLPDETEAIEVAEQTDIAAATPIQLEDLPAANLELVSPDIAATEQPSENQLENQLENQPEDSPVSFPQISTETS